jgi:hypothetical protein
LQLHKAIMKNIELPTPSTLSPPERAGEIAAIISACLVRCLTGSQAVDKIPHKHAVAGKKSQPENCLVF